VDRVGWFIYVGAKRTYRPKISKVKGKVGFLRCRDIDKCFG